MFKYFQGLELRGRTIHVRQTGADIRVDWALLRSALAVVQINFWIFFSGLRRTKNGTMAFFPQRSGPWYNAWMIARLAGLKNVKDPAKADHIFIFDDSTLSDAADGAPHDIALINANIRDISKTHVAEVFTRVFGYGLAIDPLVYEGRAVQKSNKNGTHDGVLIECPIAPDAIQPDSAYQRYVDTSRDGGKTTEDLRIAYVFGDIPVVFHKWKNFDHQFSTSYLRTDVKMTEDVFSAEETALLIRFCQMMGLDFGAVDVMRDFTDGRLYVVDVNKTCMPVLSLPMEEQRKAMRRIADVFRRALLSSQ